MKDRNVDPVNRCPYYSRESIVTGFLDGDVEDPEFEEFDFCNLPGNKGYCLLCGNNDECEVFKDGKED